MRDPTYPQAGRPVPAVSSHALTPAISAAVCRSRLVMRNALLLVLAHVSLSWRVTRGSTSASDIVAGAECCCVLTVCVWWELLDTVVFDAVVARYSLLLTDYALMSDGKGVISNE